MLIEVTQEHIDQGEPGSAERCPIALAIVEQRPDTYTALVASQFADIYEDDPFSEGYHPRIQYRTTKKMSDFFRRFDEHKPVEPMTFRLMRFYRREHD